MGIKVEYTVKAEQEHTPVTGNAMASGDAEADRACEAEILSRLDRGDIWAWAYVTVTAEVEVDGEVFTGTASLGQCSYKDEAQFRADGYFADMCGEALADLRNELTTADNRGDAARKALRGLGK